jgi:uncharacterized metal-binding protein
MGNYGAYYAAARGKSCSKRAEANGVEWARRGRDALSVPAAQEPGGYGGVLSATEGRRFLSLELCQAETGCVAEKVRRQIIEFERVKINLRLL